MASQALHLCLANLCVSSASCCLQFNVTGETLDQALLQQQQSERIALVKLDVEGYEPQVLAGASQLLQKQLIDNVLLEYSPHIVERNK
jgi:FkbM family methyltransferase